MSAAKYTKRQLKKKIAEFMEYQEKHYPTGIPYKKFLCPYLDVSKYTLYRYTKEWPELFEDLNYQTKRKICIAAFEGRMKHDKALYLLLKNYDRPDNIQGIVTKAIRFNTPNALGDALIAYASTVGIEAKVVE